MQRSIRQLVFVVALASGFAAAPAHAIPFPLTFTGPGGFGVSERDALDASRTLGIDIVLTDFAGEATGVLEVSFNNIDESSADPFPPQGPGPHTVRSNWRIRNESSFDLMGATYVMFVTSDPAFVFGGGSASYDDESVGLVVDPDDGWVLIQAGSFFYPAFLLGSLEAGQVSDRFSVEYFIDQRVERVGGRFVAPNLRLGLAFSAGGVPVPEPSTAALVGLGLLGFAARRGRRR